METTNTTTWAATAGRIAGTAARGLIWAHQQIDWAEVAAIVAEGLKVLIVLTLLAGRGTRRGWDALLRWSEVLGRRYARLIAPAPAAITAPQPTGPIVTHRRIELEALSCRQLRELTGTRRKLAKRQLIALAMAC